MPCQIETYGFDVRRYDLGVRGPELIRRFSRELSELRDISSGRHPPGVGAEGEPEDIVPPQGHSCV